MFIELQSSGGAICIYPQESRRKRAAWIMWIYEDGSASLWTKREETGAIIEGSEIKLPKNVSRKVKVIKRGEGYFDENTAEKIDSLELASQKAHKKG